MFKYGSCEDPDFHSVTCDFEEEHICGYQSDPKGIILSLIFIINKIVIKL
jgi:hypothetical protein